MKRDFYLHGLLSLVCGLSLAGCGGGGASPAPQSTAYPAAPAVSTLPPSGYPAMPTVFVPAPTGYPAAAPSATPAPRAAPTEADAGSSLALVTLAKADLAKRLSVSADQITLVSSEYKDWSDASLGCSKPGMAYAQVITPGYLILLEQAQKQYPYHTDLKDYLILCQP